MNPRDFNEFANECSARPESEAALRSAVSRAYYAVYHVSSGYLAKREIEIAEGHGEHEKIVRTMKREFPHDLDKIQWLWTLKQHREQADYKISSRADLQVKHPRDAVRRASRYMEWLDRQP